MFAYPPPVTTETKDTGPKVPQAVLSTTAKAKDKAKKKEAEKAVKEGRSTADLDKDGSDKAEGTLHLPIGWTVMSLGLWQHARFAFTYVRMWLAVTLSAICSGQSALL